MKGYIAKSDYGAMFLTKDSQFDTALKNGCNIIRVEDNDEQTVIATPELGFVEKRPTIEKSETMINPYAELLTLLEKGE